MFGINAADPARFDISFLMKIKVYNQLMILVIRDLTD